MTRPERSDDEALEAKIEAAVERALDEWEDDPFIAASDSLHVTAAVVAVLGETRLAAERRAVAAEAQVAQLREAVDTIREWAYANHGGVKTPAEVWPGLAAALAAASGVAPDQPNGADDA